jgi:predicted nucleic acid-binding protein
MSDSAVADSACLIALKQIGREALLPQLFDEIRIPPVVQDEIGTVFPWLKVQAVRDVALIAALKTQMDEGEAHVIALATEKTDVFVILDDRKARRIAKQMGLRVIGTVGILLRSKQHGHLTEITSEIEALERVGFYLTESLRREALSLAGEDSQG